MVSCLIFGCGNRTGNDKETTLDASVKSEKNGTKSQPETSRLRTYDKGGSESEKKQN